MPDVNNANECSDKLRLPFWIGNSHCSTTLEAPTARLGRVIIELIAAIAVIRLNIGPVTVTEERLSERMVAKRSAILSLMNPSKVISRRLVLRAKPEALKKVAQTGKPYSELTELQFFGLLTIWNR